MWQRYTLYDFRIIAHYLGVLLMLLAVALSVPLAVGLIFQEWEPASRYLLATGISLSAGSALRMTRIEPSHLSRHQAIAVTGFAWIVLSAVAAIPLAFSAHYASYADALFDAVSAFTESVAMASNSGITTGIAAPDMPGLLKAIYIVEMWAGRLEFVTLIALGIKIFVSLKPRISLKRGAH